MKTPRVQFTVRRMMIGVALAAALIGALVSIPDATRRAQARESGLRHRSKAAILRASAARLRLCPTGHPRGVSRGECPRCEDAWHRSYLRKHIALRERGISVLEDAAAVLDRCADRCDSWAILPWQAEVVVDPGEREAVRGALLGRGDIVLLWRPPPEGLQ